MKHYEYEINLFIDNELDESSQKDLFLHLSQCEECRRDFAKYLIIKEKSRKVIAKDMLSMKTFFLKKKDQPANNIYNRAAVFVMAAAAVILLFLQVQKAPEAPLIVEKFKTDTVFIHTVATNKSDQGPVDLPKAESSVKSSPRNDMRYIMSLREIKLTVADQIEIKKERKL
ncbi:MAG TPA: zf-HC2 domain-containing protein [Ignavibacteriales bacterium]|nr:zf-HC2 domain-containing protein [Ignavibacteriales bacterium]